jgi:hypothetical protein
MVVPAFAGEALSSVMKSAASSATPNLTRHIMTNMFDLIGLTSF